MTMPEARARAEIDRLLSSAGWHVRNYKEANIHASRGVAIRESPLAEGHGEADSFLCIDRKAAGYHLSYRDKPTRKVRWERLDEDFAYDPGRLDRAVQTPDQIRTIAGFCRHGFARPADAAHSPAQTTWRCEQHIAQY